MEIEVLKELLLNSKVRNQYLDTLTDFRCILHRVRLQKLF